MTDAQQMVERAADNSVDRAGHRTQWIVTGVLLVSVAALAVAFFSLWSTSAEQGRDLVAVSERADDNGDIARQLADQVRALGAQPAVSPPPAGDDGRDGADGLDERVGRDGKDGASPPCLAEPAQCRGVDGLDGRDGVDGADGQDGADGRDGVDGEDGQPPASFTLTDPAGREHACTRNPESPDNTPTCTCTAEQPPSTVPALPTLRGSR